MDYITIHSKTVFEQHYQRPISIIKDGNTQNKNNKLSLDKMLQ